MSVFENVAGVVLFIGTLFLFISTAFLWGSYFNAKALIEKCQEKHDTYKCVQVYVPHDSVEEESDE